MPGRLESCEKNHAQYLFAEEGHNNLSERACLHLSKVLWPNLEYLNLGISFTVFNKIGIEGCLHLSKAEWPLLAHLDLCNIDPIQKATKLDPKDVST